ncbi:MAG: prepilin peptidase [bacterium]|nr:prepilin peptidase [bacterium]
MLLYPALLGTTVFILGTIVGSFLNVLIYRMGSGAGFLGRSKCLSCGKTLSALMLIPLISFFLQRGRCVHCGAKLSWQYPLVEGTTGLLYLLVWSVHGFDPLTSDMLEIALFLLDAAIWSILLSIIVYDLKHKIIPDRLSLLFALLAGTGLFLKWQWGLLTPIFLPLLGVYIPVWLDALAGPLLALPFALLWLLSGGRAMGLGDATLAWGLGWFLGFSGGISAVVLGFWTAFFPSLFLLLLRRKRFTMKSEVPFAPFLVLGALIVYWFGIDLLQWTL